MTHATRRRATDKTKQVVRWALGHVMPRTVLKLAGRRGDLQGQLVAVERGGDPFPVLERMRAQGPLYHGKFAYVATSLPLVREVLSSNDFRTGFEAADLSGPLGRAFELGRRTPGRSGRSSHRPCWSPSRRTTPATASW